MNRSKLSAMTLGAVVAAALAATLTGCSSHTPTIAHGLAPAAVHTSSTNARPAVMAVAAAKSASTPRCPSVAQAMAIVQTLTGPHIALDPVHGYGCARGWAYVNYRQVPIGNHATKALQYVNGAWVIGDRLLGCGDETHRPAMPPSIYRYGCGN